MNRQHIASELLQAAKEITAAQGDGIKKRFDSQVKETLRDQADVTLRMLKTIKSKLPDAEIR